MDGHRGADRHEFIVGTGGLFHGNQHVLQWNTFQLLALMRQHHRFRAKVAEWSVLPLVRPARKITDVSVSSRRESARDAELPLLK